MHQTLYPHQARLLLTHDNSDPYFSRWVSAHTTTYSIALITSDTQYLRIHELDADSIQNIDTKRNITIFNDKEHLRSSLETTLREQNINHILLNYSTMEDSSVDVLGHGIYTHLTEKIQNIDSSMSFGSAEHLIYASIDTKTPDQIEKMRIAAHRAHHIIIQTLQSISPGMTEQDVHVLCHTIQKETYQDFIKQYPSVRHESHARDTAHCPIVLSGDNFTKGGHALPSDTIIQPGETIYMDFGVTLTFDDGSSRSSDLQRMAYILKSNETQPPEKIQKRFDDIIQSISLGIQTLHPDHTGHQVDQAVRSHLHDQGYPNYNHSTGHPIGEQAHNPGTAISPSTNPRSHLHITNHGVYTIEPRIPVPNGISIEEMVVVDTKNGNYTLCPRQTHLILIQPHDH